MDAEKRPPLRESLEIEYEDGRRETVVVRRLSNTDLIAWVDTGFSKTFLVFRSVDRADKTERANQPWFDTLTQDSAFVIVEKALALNHSPDLQKKILGPAAALLGSFLSTIQSSSSAVADTTQKS